MVEHVRTAQSYTPGPWAVDLLHTHGLCPLLAVVTKRVTVAEIPVAQGADGDTREANAHLIAAAPELLDALRNVVMWMEITVPARDLFGLDVHREAVAAIRKARARA